MSAADMTTLSDLARRVGGSLHGADAGFTRVVTDSRQLCRGDLFVALTGEHFDGHDFVRRAFNLGAAGALVARPVDGVPAQVVVAPGMDTLDALQRFAASWRADFTLPLVGVTGSVGKTTTKQMLAEILTVLGPVLATEGNLNNHIGVPLTLCRLRAGHRAAVIEMGANHAGEIAALAALARPGIGLVTMAGDAHLEGFGSRDGVAHAKGEMFAALGGRGVAVINADDVYAPLWKQLAGTARILSFGFGGDADVRATHVQMHATGSRFTLHAHQSQAGVSLTLSGRHNVVNAVAAAAAAIAAGVDLAAVAAGLGRIRPVAGRGVWTRTVQGAAVLDDTYNANPTSVRAALEVLAQRSGTRIAVLGDMGELGTGAAELHRLIGADARALGLDALYGLGALSASTVRGFGRGAAHFDSVEALTAALRPQLGPQVSVLVKGSRSARMERVVAALTGQFAEASH